MIKQLIILSLAVTIIFAAPGSEVYCNTNDQSQCGSPGNSSWVAGSTTGKSKISECNSVGSILTNVYDTLCQSCLSGNNSYAKSQNNGCQGTVGTAGQLVPCQKSNTCSSCGTISPAFAWSIPASDTTNCIITSCLAAPMPTVNLIDNFCKSCGGSNLYANSYGTACVNSSDSCSRTTNLSDSDCNTCNASGANSANKFVNTDKKACVSSAFSCTSRTTNSNPWTDSDCSKCNTGSTTKGTQLYANTDGSSCAASSATCQSSRTSGWTDSDCVICNTGTATSTLLFAKADQSSCQATVAQKGTNVPCQNSGSCTNCGTFTNFQFDIPSSDNQNCYVKSCLAAPMPTSGLNDYFCGSCNKTNKFANSYGTACVNSSDSCSRTTNLSDSDCNTCNASGANSANKFVNTDKKACVSSAFSCTSRTTNSNPWTDSDCSKCNTGSTTKGTQLYANTDGSSCAASSATCQSSRTSGWTDSDCSKCNTGSTTKGTQLYANTDGSSCASSSATCSSSRTSGWTDSDCSKCNTGTATPTLLFTKADQSSCQATVALQGTNVPCQNTGSCTNCGTFTNFLFAVPSSDTQNCYVKSCLGAPMPTSGLNDYFCGSCNKTNKFANAYTNACVNSTASCTRSSGWTDSDCQVCNASGANSANQYASADQKSCVSTKPSSSSTSSPSSSSIVLAFSSLIIACLLI